MIKNLIKVASELDRIGLTKEADTIDLIIRKVSGKMHGGKVNRKDDVGPGFWYHIYPAEILEDGTEIKTFTPVLTGPNRKDYKKDAEKYLSELGLNPSSLERSYYGADSDYDNERGAYHWEDENGANTLSFWWDLDAAKRLRLKLR